MRQPAGLLLLTGGAGRRLGGPKHNRPHPAGGTWGGYLVRVFQAVFPGGPVRLLGDELEDHPELLALADAGEGPAAALVCWATVEEDLPLRWWVVACDQVRWTEEALRAWYRAVEQADPEAEHWVMARAGEYTQYLGGFLPSPLVPGLIQRKAHGMKDLVIEMPNCVIPWPHDCWEDLDTPGDCNQWLTEEPGSCR